eukprot:8963423-Pyramimonas_sp.AAC.1
MFRTLYLLAMRDSCILFCAIPTAMNCVGVAVVSVMPHASVNHWPTLKTAGERNHDQGRRENGPGPRQVALGTLLAVVAVVVIVVAACEPTACNATGRRHHTVDARCARCRCCHGCRCNTSPTTSTVPTPSLLGLRACLETPLQLADGPIALLPRALGRLLAGRKLGSG